LLASQEDDMSTTGTRTPRIVVGYDASASAKLAVGWAADEAARRTLPLTVVYAVDYTGLVGGPISTSPWLPGVSVEEAQRVVERGAEIARAGRPGLSVHAATFIGSPATVLVDQSRGADLVVVGTRGHGDVAGLLLGSVASRVAAHGHCPVVVVRGDSAVAAGPERPVVVGVDGSEASATALRTAVTQARATGARLRIVCAWNPTAPGGWDRVYWEEVTGEEVTAEDPDAAAREAAEGVAARAAADVAALAPDLTVDVRVRGGDPAAVVIDSAGDAGLVVVGARGRGSLASLFLGSVSHGVVHGAHVPVLVVRAPARRAAEPAKPADPAHGTAGSGVPVGLL
jgi:nucleotide-binding universal stress UspA family protein